MASSASRVAAELFIAVVRPYRFLYDKRCPEFKDIALKENTWNAIGAELGITGEQCVIKWKSLRDRYVRIRKELDLKMIEPSNCKKIWKLYDIMDEILSGSQDCLDSVLATQDICQEETILPNSYDEAIVIKNEMSNDDDSMSVWNKAVTPDMSDFLCISLKDKRKKKRNFPVTEHERESSAKKSNPEVLFLHQTEATSTPAETITKNPVKLSTFEDEAFHFAMNIALRLRKLQRMPMLKAMNSLENALFAIETEHVE